MASRPLALDRDFISSRNRKAARELGADCKYLARTLKRKGIEFEAMLEGVRAFTVAVPSWGVRTGGTRFGSFPVPGQPRDLFEKLDDAAVVNQLTAAAPRVSLHIPWDKTDDPAAVRKHARSLGLGFDAMNSNTFEDQPGQERSYKFGSLAHVDAAVRDQAVALNLETIAIGRALGAKALTIWIGDGANFPGQAALGPSFERCLDSLRRIYRGLPRDWRLFLEYKPFEPAFYYTVLADWGSALMASLEIGERCAVLVDLGHHLPGTNIEAIVARLIRAGKLGGFHLNDNHYADDDLTAGSIQPYRLFRVFHELVLAGANPKKNFRPAYMIDQSHNVKDPIEALIQTTMEMQNLWARALLVDRERLAEYQRLNDALGAEMELKDAFNTDVRPLTAMARVRGDAAAAPLATYRASGYRSAKARERG